MKILLTALSILFFTQLSQAQIEKVVHQTFDLGDNKSISLGIVGEVQVVPWAGNTIMTETRIEIYDASPSIFNHFLEVERRYEIEADTTGNQFKLYSFDQERKAIKTKNGTCPEIVEIKVYVPEEFHQQDELTLVRTD